MLNLVYVTVTARYYSNCCVLLANSAQMQLYCSEWLIAAAYLVSHSSELRWELGEFVLKLLCVF
jgi:TRAP-type mannitol/chloroaromatic compound transport system permease small subunit